MIVERRWIGSAVVTSLACGSLRAGFAGLQLPPAELAGFVVAADVDGAVAVEVFLADGERAERRIAAGCWIAGIALFVIGAISSVVFHISVPHA